VSHQPTVKRLKPPDSLSKAEAALFNEIVGSMPPDYFNHTDRLLLVRYVEAHAQAELAKRHLAKEGMVTKTGKPSPWITVQEKARRAVVALSIRLRLSPRSRLDRVKAGKLAAVKTSAYDLMNLDDD